MEKKSDLKSIKSIAVALLYQDIMKTDLPPMLAVVHPVFENSTYVTKQDGELKLLDLMDENNLRIAQDEIKSRINNSTTVLDVYFFIRKSYRMTFLKFAKPYMSKKDFSSLLSHAWTSMEYPNVDANVSIKTAISWFKQADEQALMEEDEYTFYESLPETVTVYRGVRSRGNPNGISWTLNKDTALWFSTRFGRVTNDGVVWVAEVKKENILAYFNGRNEHEVIIDTTKIERRKLNE